MKLTVGTLLSMANYLAELAKVRAVARAMIVTTMSAYHRQRISVTGARRVSDGVALAAHMKLTVSTLRSMTNNLAELADIRAVLGAMIVTTMSADHAKDICGSFQIVYKSFKFANCFAGPCQPARLSGCDPHCWMCTPSALGALF
jgi:hypothetical protein